LIVYIGHVLSKNIFTVKKLLIAALCALPMTVLAQQVQVLNNFQITASEPFESFGTSRSMSIEAPTTFFKNDELLSFRFSAGKFSFQKYAGSEMNEIQRVQLDKRQDFLKEVVIEVGGRFYFCFSPFHQLNRKNSLIAREIDFENGSFIGDEKVLFDSPEKMMPVRTWANIYSKYNFAQSFDGGKLMAIHQTKSGNKKSKNKVVGLHVYDGAMNQLWYQEVVLPYKSKEVNFIDAAVDSDGRAYLLIELLKRAYKKNGSGSGTPLKVLYVNSHDGSVSPADIDMGGKAINSAKLFENSNGEIALSGLYAVGGIKNSSDGVYIVKLSIEGKVLINEIHEVPNEVIALNTSTQNQLNIERSSETTNWGLKDMVLREVIPGNDGSTIVLAERLLVKKGFPLTVSEHSQVKSNLYYGSILAARMEADGTLSWMKKLPKNQMARFAGRPHSEFIKDKVVGDMGFATINRHSDPIIVFADNDKNLELPDNEVPSTHWDRFGGYLTAYRINRLSGDVEKMSLFALSNYEGMILNSYGIDRVYQLAENEFAVEFNTTLEGNKKKSVLVKVSLNE